MRAHRADRRASVRAAVVVIGSALLAVAASVAPWGASAFWTTTTATGSAGRAAVASLGQGATPTVAVQDRTGVTVSWTASSLSNGTAATGYTVRRLNASNVQQTVLAGCSGTVTALTCTESGIPDGVWTYTITPRFESWSGTTSPASAAVRTDGTAPVNAVTIDSAVNASKTNNTIYYRGNAAGSFTLVNTLTDAGSGPESSTTSAFSGTSTGWTHTPSTTSTPAGGPFESQPFSWASGTNNAPTVTVTGTDAYGNTAATTLTMTRDITAPAATTITYPGGATNTSTVDVSLGATSDAASGVATRSLQRRTATLNATSSNCGSYGSWNEIADDLPAAASVQEVALTAGQCSQYRYVVTDAVGNSRTVTGATTVKAKGYAALVAGTSGLVSYYRLGDSGSTTADAFGSNDGTQIGTTTGPSAINDDGSSKSYNGSNQYNRVPRSISANFSIELWFRTTQSSGSGTQWYNGVGLVDADVPGNANDFGIGLVAGKVVAGTGNTDRSVSSTNAYNDDAWHHVVMTRAQNGVVTLYVDGASQGTVATNNLALTASGNIDFGRQQPGVQYFQGFLDEISLYNRVLTQTEVTQHYQAGNSV